MPLATFEAAYRLLQQMAELPGAIFLGDEAIYGVQNSQKNQTERFAAVVSQDFNALLRGKQLDELEMGSKTPQVENFTSQLNVELSFDPETIAHFLAPIAELLAETATAPARPIDISDLKRRMQNLQPNSAAMQSEFTMNLLEILAPQASANSQIPLQTATEIAANTAIELIPVARSEGNNSSAVIQQQIATSCASYCQPVEDALQQQLEQEKLLNEVISQIRQSLELPTILSQAVDRVREFWKSIDC